MAQVLLLPAISLALFLGTWLATRWRFAASVVALLSVIAFGVGISTGSELLLVQSVVTGACVFPHRSAPRRLFAAAAVAFALSVGIYVIERVPELRRASRIRKANPQISVAARLQYESRVSDDTGDQSDVDSQATLSEPVVRRLAKLDESMAYWGDYRRFLLKSLHERTRDQFILSPEFGRVRALPLSWMRIKIPEPSLVSIPRREQWSEAIPGDSAGQEAAGPIVTRPPSPDALEAVHEGGELDFLHPVRLGYVQDKDHVAGFISHRFSEFPSLKAGNAPRWVVVRLELVSLLKHDQPVAYVSDNLPNMDELRDAPTRPLEDFENAALHRLRAEDDVVIDEAPHRLRMLGSLRAATRCLECHSVRRGDLLGALSYELVPEQWDRRASDATEPEI